MPRTLFDLAAVVTRHQLEAALNEVEVQGLTDRLSVVDLLKRYPGRRGATVLVGKSNDAEGDVDWDAAGAAQPGA